MPSGTMSPGNISILNEIDSIEKQFASEVNLSNTQLTTDGNKGLIKISENEPAYQYVSTSVYPLRSFTYDNTSAEYPIDRYPIGSTSNSNKNGRLSMDKNMMSSHAMFNEQSIPHNGLTVRSSQKNVYMPLSR